MALPDAQSVATKWVQRTSAAATDYGTAVAQSDKDPTALAIQAGPRYLQRVQDAFNSGKWANGLRRSGKTGWQNGVATKGIQNFSNSVGQSGPKVAAAFAPLLAFEASGLSQLASMPNLTDADKDNRALFWIRYMRGYVKPA